MVKYEFFNKARKLFYSAVLSGLVLFGVESGLEGLVGSSQAYTKSKGSELTDIFRNPMTPFRKSMVEAEKNYDSSKDKTEKSQIYWDRAWFEAYHQLIDYLFEFDKANPGLSYGKKILDNLDINDPNQVKDFETNVVPIAFAQLDPIDSTAVNEFSVRKDVDSIRDCYTNEQGDDLTHRICWAEMVGCWHRIPGQWDDLGKFIITRRGVPKSYELPVMEDSLVMKYGDGSQFICKKGKGGWTFANSDRNTILNYAETQGKFFSLSEFDTLRGISISSAGPFPSRHSADYSLSVLDLFGKIGDLWTEKEDSAGEKHRTIDLDIDVNVWGFPGESGRETNPVLLYDYNKKMKGDISGNDKKDVFYMGLDVGPFFSGNYSHFKQGVEITNHGKTEQKKSWASQWEFPQGIPIYSMIAERDTVIVRDKSMGRHNEKDTTYLHTKRKSGIHPLGSNVVEIGKNIQVGFPLVYSGPERDSALVDTVKIYLTPLEENDNIRVSIPEGKFREQTPKYVSLSPRDLETAISLGAEVDTFDVGGVVRYDLTQSVWEKLSKRINAMRKTGDSVSFQEPVVDTLIEANIVSDSPPDNYVYNLGNPSWIFPIKMGSESYKWFSCSLLIPDDLDMRGSWNVTASYIATTNSKEKPTQLQGAASMVIKIKE